MTSIKHLKCLSAINSMANIKQLTPAAFPGNHCPMHTALSLGSRIKGVSTLVIGAAECGYYSRNVPLASPYVGQGAHWSYILDSKEVVFGFRKGLIDAIKEMDRFGAEVLLLLATCLPELIGEDIKSICHEIQPEIKARLITIPLGNFKCGSHQSGYWKTLLAFSELVVKTEKKIRTVNVLGRSVMEKNISMPELLASLNQSGISCRFLAPDSSLDDFLSAGDASLNIVLSPFMNPLAVQMEKEHSIPFVSLHELYHIKDIEKAYSQIDRILGTAVAKESENQRQQTKKLQKKAAVQLKGLSFISANSGALQPLPLSLFLAELGMSPIMVHMEEFYPTDTQWKEKLLAYNHNPIICLMLNEEADEPIIDALCPHFVFGDWGGRNKDNALTVPLQDLYGQVGYERTVVLLERIMKKLAAEKGDDENGSV